MGGKLELWCPKTPASHGTGVPATPREMASHPPLPVLDVLRRPGCGEALPSTAQAAAAAQSLRGTDLGPGNAM